MGEAGVTALVRSLITWWLRDCFPASEEGICDLRLSMEPGVQCTRISPMRVA